MPPTLSIYIIYHDKTSFDLFQENNKHIDTSNFKFILVGDWDGIGAIANDEHIVACRYPNNIEKNKSLLTFTAWWLLAKNELVKTSHIGIFEYDVIFKQDIFELEEYLDKDTFIGFVPREVKDDAMYLDFIPKFCQLLEVEDVQKAKSKPLWSASTNCIIPEWFLFAFSSWYIGLVPKILDMPGHAHYHERALNILAANFDMEYVFKAEYVEHKGLMSHGIDFVQC
jgi:hypothetical protein